MGLLDIPKHFIVILIIFHFSFDESILNQRVNAVLEVISGKSFEMTRSKMFLHLLQKLTEIISCEKSHSDIILPTRVSSPKNNELQLSKLREKISLMNLLAALTEKYEDQVIQSGSHILCFVRATLHRCLMVCEGTSEERTVSFEWETVGMALGLLTVVLSGAVEVNWRAGLVLS